MNTQTESSDIERLMGLFETLTGREAPIKASFIPADATQLLASSEAKDGVGYSQFNELMLLFGFDRVIPEFFQFIADGSREFDHTSAIHSWGELERGVEKFQKTALVLFGNIKYAFNQLSQDGDNLDFWLDTLEEVEAENFKSRHSPVLRIDEIPGNETYMLGYIAGSEVEEAYTANPDDPEVALRKQRRDELVKQGIMNHNAYLVSDHLDVYVATSMRQRHEFLSISSVSKEIFSHPAVQPLELRYFDPTQAYCPNRIDKGLAEALMLRRAKCTVYFAQESDTLGKDSELASTLAQGKPVIAYVPEVSDGYADQLVKSISEVYPEKSRGEIIVEQLRVFDPGAAWTDPTVAEWAANPADTPIDEATTRLQGAVAKHYDSRAATLKDRHPLGIQVHLMTGVANGVLVVRSTADCAKLIRRIMTRSMEFNLKETDHSLQLIETISGCVFRVATTDYMLTNSFWNFYLDPST